MRHPFLSIEWNAAVSRLLKTSIKTGGVSNNQPAAAELALLQRAHYVLPCVPSVTEPLRDEFRHSDIPRSRRIETVVACQHTAASLRERLSSKQQDRILIVGGNDKDRRDHDDDDGFLTSPQAIELAAQTHCTSVWAVANPNNHDPSEAAGVVDKVQAGATGIITQPLFTSLAAHQLEQYCSCCCDISSSSSIRSNHLDPDEEDGAYDGISFIVGLAFPQSLQDLRFWFELVGLGQPEQQEYDDIMIKDHVAWFRNRRPPPSGENRSTTSLLWIQRQLQVIESLTVSSSNKDNGAAVRGVHCMPLGNTHDLLAILDDPGDNEEEEEDKARREKRKKFI